MCVAPLFTNVSQKMHKDVAKRAPWFLKTARTCLKHAHVRLASEVCYLGGTTMDTPE
jgi:hypothetical protein